MTYDPYQRPPQPAPTARFYPPAEQYPQYAEPAPQKRKLLPWLALAAALFVLAGGAWAAYDKGLIFKDPGIRVCEAFRDGKRYDGAAVTGTKADQKITEAEYLKMREVFKSSRYDDIEKAGTTLMDVVWQLSQLGDDPGIEALPYVGQTISALTAMQGACANHGIVVNLTKDAMAGN